MTIRLLDGFNAPRSSALELTAEEALQLLSRRGHHLCELFKDDQETKLYLDRDEPIEGEITDDLVRERRAEVETKVNALLNGSDFTYVIAERHGYCPSRGCNKLSFRPYIQGARVRYTLIPEIIRACKQDDFWDTKVYHRGQQLLACINGTKTAEDPRVLLMGHDRDLSKYVASVVDPAWEELREPVDNDSVSEDAATDNVADSPDDNGEVDEIFVTEVLDIIDPKLLEDYETWRNIGFGCHCASEGTDRFLPHFKRASARPKRYSDARAQWSCEVLWRNIKLERAGRTTFRSVCRLAKQCDPVRFEAAVQHRWFRKAFVAVPQDTNTPDVGPTQFFGHLAARFPDACGGLKKSDGVMSVLDPDGANAAAVCKVHGLKPGTLMFRTDSRTLLFMPDFPDVTVWLLHSDGTREFLGPLINDVTLKGRPLSDLHSSIPAYIKEFTYNRTKHEEAVIKSCAAGPRVDIQMTGWDNGWRQALVNVQGVRGTIVSTVDKQAKLRKLLDLFNKVASDAVVARFGSELPAVFVNNGTVNVFFGNDSNEPSDFEIVRDRLLGDAMSRKLRKRNDMIYAPVPGCPCAYAEHMPFKEHINAVLRNDAAYYRNPKRHDELLKLLQNYDPPQLPNLDADRDLLSFRNGVLCLGTREFVRYDQDPFPLAGRVARHHIDAEYTGSEETPALDVVLSAQFDDEVAEFLCSLLGRSLFRVKQVDNFQVMLYLVGLAGTGKSLVVSVLTSMFAPSEVASLATSREAVFGLANLKDKELVVGKDMPAKLSAVLSQEQMQMMTSGEGMEIAQKHKETANIRAWKSPVVMASNHMPDYVNTGNNVVRRVVPIRFGNMITDPRDDLEDKLQAELPNVVCRCLAAYARLRQRVAEVGGFWKAVPSVVLEWRGELAASTNRLHEFLALDPEERGYKIEHVPGKHTLIRELREAYSRCASATDRNWKEPYQTDHAVLRSFGFVALDKPPYDNVCKTCRQVARGGSARCCLAYAVDNRTKAPTIANMVLTAIPRHDIDDM